MDNSRIVYSSKLKCILDISVKQKETLYSIEYYICWIETMLNESAKMDTKYYWLFYPTIFNITQYQ